MRLLPPVQIMAGSISLKIITRVTVLSLFFPAVLCNGAGLAEKIDSIISRESQKKGVFAINITDTSGNTIYTKKTHTPMTPASTMKLVTTAAAVHYLGADYEYVTTIGISPESNLVIIGSGDPLFGYDNYLQVLSKITTALKYHEISEVNDIIIDTGVFDDDRAHPNWPESQLNRWYACEVSGLNFNANCLEMTVTNKNGQVDIDIVPNTDFIKINNKVRIISSGRGAVGAYRIPGKINHLEVKGNVRDKQGPFKVAIQRPAGFFGYILAEHLLEKGINVKGKLLIINNRGKYNIDKLVEFRTPISECLAKANKISLSLSAEVLLKTIAAESNNGTNGSWEKGRELIHGYLRTLGVSEDEFYVDDGSGLSRKNRLSPYVLTAVLSDMYQSSGKEVFHNSLAIGGEDGTIAGYFRDDAYAGKIRGKTGYIAGVKSFAGIAECPEQDYFFSIIANNANGKSRKAINDIAKAIIDYYGKTRN